MNEKKCFVIMQTAWAWNDSSYYLENSLSGYPQNAYASKEQAEKVKDKMEYERWRDGMTNNYDGGALYLYENLDFLESFEAKLKSKGFDLLNLSEDAYHFLRKLISQKLRENFQELMQKTTEKDWISFLENDFYNPISDYIRFRSSDKVKKVLKSKGYPLDKTISKTGLQFLQNIIYEEYFKIPEFYYVQEAVLVDE